MTLDEWIAFYDKKTPDPFKPDERMSFFFRNDKGFCEVGMSDKSVMIGQMAGDGLWWKEKVDELARTMGRKIVSCFCVRRSVKAYLRFFGYRMEGWSSVGEYTQYVYANKKSGKYLLAFPTGRFSNGVHIYFLEWEV